LIVLDINLPDGSGFDLCRDIKARNDNAAVVFLTANDMESDMIRGFEFGADDYVTKPFPISVFQHKVSALLSRIAKQASGDCYDDSNLIINFTEMTAAYVSNPILFTPIEYRLLKVFIKNPHIVLTRQVLLEKIWDIDGNYVEEHTLTATISRLRAKLEISGAQYIKTVYGMGYIWTGGANDER
jgi:DNA-binding response OmpR family regulator